MTRNMKLPGGILVVIGLLALSSCYSTPQTTIPAGSGGTGGGGAAGGGGESGRGGTAGGGAGGGGGRGGSSVGGSGATAGGGAGGQSGSTGGEAGGGRGGSGGSGGTSGTGGGGTAGGGVGAGGGGGTGGAAACAPACDATHVCTGGRCLLADAQPCVTGSQCASGACNPFYADVDNDGYGTGQAVGFCTLTTPPVGYAAQNGDCCDNAPNIATAKLIHPGADFQTTSAGGVCNITWDYDCSGAVEKQVNTCSGCTPAPDCQCVVAEFPDSYCGNVEGRSLCFAMNEGVGGISCGGAGSATFVLPCR